MMLMLDVLVHPNRKPIWPALDQFFARRRLAPLGLGCAAARFARLRSASAQRGQGGWKKANLQKDFYTSLLDSC
jgi:hypothetical protein